MSKPLSRRLFSKAMAAVPLAVPEAPKLAAQNHAAGADTMALTASEILKDPYPPKPMSDADWRAHRAKELQAIIDGKEDDSDRQIAGASYVAHHYDSLKSISPGMRAVLFDRENARRARLGRISWAKRELANLVRKFF